jgi:hypothetical protein
MLLSLNAQGKKRRNPKITKLGAKYGIWFWESNIYLEVLGQMSE